MIRFTLPWPPKGLSPNARNHWAKTAKLKRAYREACRWQAIGQEGAKFDAGAVLSVRLTFHPPDRRKRDWDNLIASMKSGLDGLADALGVDDSRWRISFDVSEQIGGMVKVEVQPMEAMA